MKALLDRLNAPRSIASLAMFRVMFGTLMCVSALRFMAYGWVDRFFVERTFFFKYWGFSWIDPGQGWAMYGVYTLLALLGAAIALGLMYRVAIVAFFLLFSYAELTDVTNYLNHYYLVSLLALLMSTMPLNGRFSLDALLHPRVARDQVPAWMLYLLRFQVATVYFYAALAKVGSDWLLHGQPLNLWLSTQTDLPLIGPYMGLPEVALFASWAGFLHDLLVVPLLCYRRTRAYAYGLLAGFHLITSTWFNIGIFPVLMPMAATLFFEPDWPLRLLARLRRARASEHKPSAPRFVAALGPTGAIVMAGYCALQLLLPLRTHLYAGNVLWHEQGMRFSWRVMLRSKQGSVMYRVRLPNGREVRVSPRKYLTSDQEREMSSQPDLILQLAHYIAEDIARRGQLAAGEHVEVRVDALVSLNGRPPVRMIDPDVDLARIDDGLARASWVLPAPENAPIHLMPKPTYAAVVR